MKKYLANISKLIMIKLIDIAYRLRTGRHLLDILIESVMLKTTTIQHDNLYLRFSDPNLLCDFRIKTFSSKEPETLAWIDKMPSGSIFWDVGANIGLYSCYAGTKNGIQVIAFEPSVFNIDLLAKNVFLNDLVDRVTIVPLPLSDTTRSGTFNMRSLAKGSALSTFNEIYGDDGKAFDISFAYRTISLSLDAAVKVLNLPQPTHIKIDVDGIEHLILAGGILILKNVQSVAVEVNEDFPLQVVKVRNYLNAAGLTFYEKKHSVMFDGSSRWGATYNQFWHRLND